MVAMLHAAQHGSAEATSALGYCYASGLGVERNEKEVRAGLSLSPPCPRRSTVLCLWSLLSATSPVPLNPHTPTDSPTDRTGLLLVPARLRYVRSRPYSVQFGSNVRAALVHLLTASLYPPSTVVLS